MSSVIEIESLEHRQKIINENHIVVIKYGAEWCGPCKKSKPAYNSLCASDDSKQCIYATEDIDDEYENYPENITSIPTFHFYKNKEFVKSIMGADMLSVVDVLEELNKIK